MAKVPHDPRVDCGLASEGDLREEEPMSASVGRQPAVRFIFVTYVLLVMGFGILIPVLPGLVTEFQGGSVAEGSHAYGWLLGSFALVQFVASPILGALSDRFGRRRVLLLALSGAAIDYVIMGLAPSIGWLFLGRMISGATAGALSTCNAYVADVTPPEKRAQGFGLLGAAFGLGFIIGPLIGGALGNINLRLPFFAAAGIVAINWLYGLLLLPESLPLQKRRPFSWRRANPIGSFGLLRRLPGVATLASVYFTYTFSSSILQNIWVLYMGYRYHWTPRQVGYSLTFAGVVMVISQARLVQPLLARLGEKRGVIVGLALTAVAYVCYGLANQGWMIYALILAGAVGGIVAPAVQSLITKHVPGTEQGAVQGTLSASVSLGNIFAPPLAAWSFGAFIPEVPGVPFFEAAVVCLIAIGLAVRSFRADVRAGNATPSISVKS